jgi:hypothetical protein
LNRINEKRGNGEFYESADIMNFRTYIVPTTIGTTFFCTQGSLMPLLLQGIRAYDTVKPIEGKKFSLGKARTAEKLMTSATCRSHQLFFA